MSSLVLMRALRLEGTGKLLAACSDQHKCLAFLGAEGAFVSWIFKRCPDWLGPGYFPGGKLRHGVALATENGTPCTDLEGELPFSLQ